MNSLEALKKSSCADERAAIKAADATEWNCPFCARRVDSIFLPCACGSEVCLGGAK